MQLGPVTSSRSLCACAVSFYFWFIFEFFLTPAVVNKACLQRVLTNAGYNG